MGSWNRCEPKTYRVNKIIPSAPLPGTDRLFPYVVIGDGSFSL